MELLPETICNFSPVQISPIGIYTHLNSSVWKDWVIFLYHIKALV